MRIQLIAMANLRVAVSISGVGKFERHEHAAIASEIFWAFAQHLPGERLPDQRRQKFVEDYPLIVPTEFAGGFVESAIVRDAAETRFIDEFVVSFEHREMKLRDERVGIVARIAGECDAFGVSREVDAVGADQKFSRVVALKQEWMADRAVAGILVTPTLSAALILSYTKIPS